MKKLTILLFILLGSVFSAYSQDMKVMFNSAGSKSDSAATKPPGKPSFCQKMLKPFKWIGNNWSAYDPEYSTPCAYDWVIQLQNTTSMEWLNMKSDDDMEIKMHSKMSNRIGPYLGYSFLIYGATVDLNALNNGLWGTKGRSEFTLSINSNLINIDIIRRRTGGDFRVSKLIGQSLETVYATESNIQDLTSEAQEYDIGSLINYEVTGFNINYFTNHRRFSNPAAYTNGAIQIKSAGSWIFGLGFTHQRTESEVNDVIVNAGFKDYVWNKMSDTEKSTVMSAFEKDVNQSFNNDFTKIAQYASGVYNKDANTYKNLISKIYNNQILQPYIFGKIVQKENGELDLTNTEMLSFLGNGMPSVTTVDDYNLHFGYAYNWVLSRRLLLGVSLIAAPGIKHIRYDNRWSMINITANELSDAMCNYYASSAYRIKLKEEGFDISDELWYQLKEDHDIKADIEDIKKDFQQGFTPEDFIVDESLTRFGCDFFGRAAIVYTNDRWRAGLSVNVNSYLMRSDALNITNTYGAAVLYVGYCFGPRKKMYRKGGSDYDTYLKYIK